MELLERRVGPCTGDKVAHTRPTVSAPPFFAHGMRNGERTDNERRAVRSDRDAGNVAVVRVVVARRPADAQHLAGVPRPRVDQIDVAGVLWIGRGRGLPSVLRGHASRPGVTGSPTSEKTSKSSGAGANLIARTAPDAMPACTRAPSHIHSRPGSGSALKPFQPAKVRSTSLLDILASTR